MKHLLKCQIIGGKHSKWIVILLEFDLEFIISKSKKSLAFIELLTEFPQTDEEVVSMDPLPDEYFFLISTFDPCYGDIILYLQV